MRLGSRSQGGVVTEPFIFVNTYRVKDGKLEDYKRSAQRVVDLANAKEPDMVHFSFYVSEDGTEVTTVQVHRNAQNMAYHMELIAPHLEEAYEYLDMSDMTIEIYGTPPDAMVTQMKQLAAPGATVTARSPLAGFTRIAETAATS